MNAARVDVGYRNGAELGELPFDADRRLNRIGRVQIRVNPADGRYGLIAIRRARGHGEVGHRVNALRLIETIEPVGVEHERVREAIVKNPEAQPQDGLRRGIFGPEAPSESKPRREIGMIMDIVLSLKTQPQAEGHIGPQAPVILSVQPEVELFDANDSRNGIAVNMREARPAANVELARHVGIQTELRKSEQAVEIGVRVVRHAIRWQGSPEFQEVFAQRHGSVVLQLVLILVVPNIAGTVAAAGERAENRHGRSECLRNLTIAVTLILEAGLIDRPRAQDLGVADLQNLLDIGDVVAL